jgi:molecular chaperone HtpG
MKEGQEHIYYLVAPNPAAAAASPHLESFRKKGVEVLLLTEVDNWVVSNLREFDGKRLQSVTLGTAGLGPLENKARRRRRNRPVPSWRPLVAQLKAVLGGKAWDVRLTNRLTSSAACIVANEQEVDRAQRLRGSGLPSQGRGRPSDYR